MSAPKRWLDEDGGATVAERALLRAGASIEAPRGAREAVWAALIAQLPPVPPTSGDVSVAAKAANAASTANAGTSGPVGGATSTGVAGGGAAMLEGALLGAGAAFALIAAYMVVMPDDAPAPAPIATVATLDARTAEARPASPRGGTSVPSSGLTPMSSAAPSSVATEPAPTASATASAPTPRSSPAPSSGAAGSGSRASAGPSAFGGGYGVSGAAPTSDRASQIREESRRLGDARAALQHGDAAVALALLERLQAAYPGAILAQEREALAVEALARSGRRTEAAARARAFLDAYPTSPFATGLQAFIP